MKLYGGIDLHSNNCVVALLDEADRVVYEQRLPNDLGYILRQLWLDPINQIDNYTKCIRPYWKYLLSFFAIGIISLNYSQKRVILA